jgi:hypothetical protein
MHGHPIERRSLRRAGPPAAEQGDVMPLRGKSAEDLVQVDLGAAGLRILAILPVDDKDSH